MRAVRACEIVEALPFGQFLLQIHVVLISQQLVKFILIGAMGAFNFSV